MADRGRDLKIGILSDASKFDLSGPANDLEQVGTAAKGMGQDADSAASDLQRLNREAQGNDLSALGQDATGAASDLQRLNSEAQSNDLDAMGKDADRAKDELKRLAAQGKDAEAELKRLDTEAKGNDLDTLAKDAKDTAAKVDSAFKKIGDSSKSGLHKVDEGTHHAGESVKEMSGEIQQQAIEGASSFDGSMSSIQDSAQATAAAALAAFGPIGAGIGVAAAAGFGYFRAQSEKAKQAITDLTDRMISDGGRLSQSSVLAKIQDFAKDGSILDLQKQAEQARIPVGDYIAALAGDPAAMERATGAVKAQQNALRGLADGTVDYSGNAAGDMQSALDDTEGKLREQAKITGTATKAVDALNAVTSDGTVVTEEHTAAVAAHATALESFVDPANVYTTLLADKTTAEQASAQATADATKDQKDSWQDYAKSVDVSVGEYLKALEKQVTAQEQWAGNLQTLAKRGVEDGVLAELEKMGPQGAPLVAKLTKASNSELAKMVGLFGRQGAAAGQSVASNLVNQRGAVSKSAQALHAAAAVQLARTITVPVELADASRAARLAWGEADRYFQQHPIQIRTTGTGKRPIKDIV